MSESLLLTVLPDAPDRCQAIGKTGNQCMYQAMEGSDKCRLHGNENVLVRRKARNYMLQRYGQRVDILTQNPNFKSLREEIALLRVCMEEIVNSCTDADDIILNSSKISQLVRDIQITMLSAQKLEERLKILIDKETLMILSDKIITVITQNVTDPDQLARIAKGIAEAIQTIEVVDGA